MSDQNQQDLAKADARAFLTGNNLPGSSDTAEPKFDRLSLHNPIARWTIAIIGGLFLMFFIVLLGTLLPFLTNKPATGQPATTATNPSPSSSSGNFFSNSSNPETQIQQDENTCSNVVNAALNC